MRYCLTGARLTREIYTFRNIRFAAPPVGDLRWRKPAPPLKNSTLQDGAYGFHCPQAQINGVNFFGSGSDSGLGTWLDNLINDLLESFETRQGSEDCLFLDIYVPGHAVRNPNATKLPVVHWFYGGGFLIGSKDYLEPVLPMYDGSGYVEEAGGNVIFMASNYRLGAFGWLAGSSMEADGLPNTGIWDQHAALQWTKDNIATLGGDPNNVTVFGESAGASSILHHLVMDGGKMDPLFNKMILMSPAYQSFFDRRGTLEDVFHNFTRLAGCNESTVACLRSAPTEALIQANIDLNAAAPPGTFMVGPAPDGALIRQSPTLEFASGNYWRGLDSAILSHVRDEATLFVDGAVSTDADATKFLHQLFPPWADGLDAAILRQYPPPSSAPHARFTDEGSRMRAIVQDSSFTCNVRNLDTAYAGKTWNMQYDIAPAWHATDLLLAFWNDGLTHGSVLGDAIQEVYPHIASLSRSYKSYITSLIRTGDPNALRAQHTDPPTPAWPRPDLLGENVTGVLQVDDGFSIIDDDTMSKSACDFWREFLAAATIEGGYVPPGALVHTHLTNDTEGASRNYSTPKMRR